MKNNWNFELLYKSNKDPQIELDILQSEKDCDEFVAKYKNGEYLESPQILLEALNDYEAFLHKNGLAVKPHLYYWLLNTKDDANEEYEKGLMRTEDISEKIENKVEFFTLNISRIEETQQQEFLKFEKLKPYAHFLESLFRTGKYALSEKEESLVTLFDTPAKGNWIKVVRALRSKASSIITKKWNS